MVKKALVTGGAGFIASHLIDRLLAGGYTVTAMDNLTEGHTENIAHLKKNKKFAFKEADLKDAKAVEKLVAGNDAQTCQCRQGRKCCPRP